MEKVFYIPHIAEQILKDLPHNEILKVCKLFDQNYVDSPLFWLHICQKKASKVSELIIVQWKEIIKEATHKVDTENNQAATKLKYMTLNLLMALHQESKTDVFDKTPIFIALKQKNLETLEYLLKKYANKFLANHESRKKIFYLVAKEHHVSVIKYITNNFFSSRPTWFFVPCACQSQRKEKDHCNDFLQFMLEYVCANCDFKEDYSFQQIYMKLYNILGNIMLTLFICHLVKDVYKIVLSIWVARG